MLASNLAPRDGAEQVLCDACIGADTHTARENAIDTAVTQLFARNSNASDGWMFGRRGARVPTGSRFIVWTLLGELLTMRATVDRAAPFVWATDVEFTTCARGRGWRL